MFTRSLDVDRGRCCAESKRPHSKCLCNSATKELRLWRHLRCMSSWFSCTSRSWSTHAHRTKGPSLGMTLNFMRLCFFSFLSLPNKMSLSEIQMDTFFLRLYCKNVKVLFLVYLHLGSRFMAATTVHELDAWTCLSLEARLRCAMSERESYSGINDSNRRHLVAGEALGIEYCWWGEEIEEPREECKLEGVYLWVYGFQTYFSSQRDVCL